MGQSQNPLRGAFRPTADGGVVRAERGFPPAPWAGPPVASERAESSGEHLRAEETGCGLDHQRQRGGVVTGAISPARHRLARSVYRSHEAIREAYLFWGGDRRAY